MHVNILKLMLLTFALHSLGFRPLRTFLTALGIAVAVGSTIIFLSLGEGLRQAFANHLGGVGPDIQVSYGPFNVNSFSTLPQLPTQFMTELEQVADEYNIQKIIPLAFFVRAGLSPVGGYAYMGLPPKQDIAEIYLGFEVAKGRAFKATDKLVAIVGEQLAKRNNLRIGDTLKLNPRASFKVIGIAHSQGGFVDNMAMVPLETLTKAIGVEDQVSFFALELTNPAKAAEVAKDLAEVFPDLDFQTRADVLSVIEQGIRISDVIRLGISIIALIVGAIAVANTMLMSVFERTREFGVVRAVGAKAHFLFRLVLTESVLLSLVGATFGVLLGRGGIGIVNIISLDLIGLEVAVLTLRLTAFAIVIALFMGLTAGLLPALRAARLPIAVAMSRE